jgi:hypothetical protein
LSGVAALRHDGHAKLRAGAHHDGNLFCVSGTDDRNRSAVVAASPIRNEGSDIGRLGQDLLASDGRVEPRPQGCVNVRHELR